MVFAIVLATRFAVIQQSNGPTSHLVAIAPAPDGIEFVETRRYPPWNSTDNREVELTRIGATVNRWETNSEQLKVEDCDCDTN